MQIDHSSNGPRVQLQPRSGAMAGTPLCRYLLFVHQGQTCAFIGLMDLPCLPLGAFVSQLGMRDGGSSVAPGRWDDDGEGSLMGVVDPTHLSCRG